MALPSLNAHGLLPEGVHAGTPDGLHERFVMDFTASETRPSLHAGLMRYRRDLLALGIHATQWIDGSFVDGTRSDPEDVDVVNFCHAGVLDRLPSTSRLLTLSLLTVRDGMQGLYGVHAFLVPVFPRRHPRWSGFEDRRRYWRRWLALPQDYTGGSKRPAPARGEKGLVQLTLGDVTLCPQIEPGP